MRNKSKGFTLLEVLITVVILAIGLLGIASLQLNALRFNHSAYLRTQASLLAYDMADRMRANRGGSVNYATDYNVTYSSASCPTSCDANGIRDMDLYEWKQALSQRLPSGNGKIEMPSAGNYIYTITIRWNDSRAETDSSNIGNASIQTFTYKTEI
ncbi:MAG: type IV pilus modification protein PilV [Gammaproteobacteria bacterium]|nr:type IV pilus modification protein PilV [Gammaproteobacteria bacterium]